MPTGVLAALSNAMLGKALQMATELSAQKARQQKLSGYNEVALTTGGRSTVILDKTRSSSELAAEAVTGAAAVAGLAGTLSEGGETPFDSATLAPGTNQDAGAIENLNSELKQETNASQTADEASESMSFQRLALKADIANTRTSLDVTRETLDQVNNQIARRAQPIDTANKPPNPETGYPGGFLPSPVLNFAKVGTALESIIEDLINSGAFTEEEIDNLRTALSKGAELNLTKFEDFVENRIIKPFTENRAAIEIIAAQLTGEQVIDVETSSIFDTVYQPPVSWSGKYILSRDGLYYDSRQGGIPFITAKKITAGSWQLRYAANRGGKGELYQPGTEGRLSNTVFSETYKNETGNVKAFWKYDDVLRGFKNDRDLAVTEVSGKIDDLIASGYEPSSTIIKNYKESYAGIGNTYQRKINKRKKQLQVAALFGPFGVTTSDDAGVGPGMFYREESMPVVENTLSECGYEHSPIVFDIDDSTGDVTSTGIDFTGSNILPIPKIQRIYIDRIPVNDFSYLRDIGFIPEIELQKSQMLHSSDLDETTGPIIPTFVTAGTDDETNIDAVPEMFLPGAGTTEWLNTSGDTDLTGDVPFIRSLDSDIVTDSLVVCYNFLEPSAVVAPSSTTFGVQNYSNAGQALNAKMVGTSTSSIFVSGVTIPYLTGTLYKPSSRWGLKYAHLDSSSGAYVRLPNNWRGGALYPASQPLDDLIRSPKGWCMDFWVYTPDLSSTLTYDHRYKVIAANENCGEPTQESSGLVFPPQAGNINTTADLSGSYTNLLYKKPRGLMVGFRDRGYPGTVQASGLEFFVLPTLAQNSDIWGKSVCIGESVSGDGYGGTCTTELGFKVPLSTSSESGYTILNAASGFTHFNVGCDYDENAISLYVNGEFLASASVSTCFATKPGQALNFPSPVSEGCHQDKTGAFFEQLFSTPELPIYPVLTPWVLGGGYTDGIAFDAPAVFSSTQPGFLGTNTNTSYFRTAMEPYGGPVGQHSDLETTPEIPGLGGYAQATSAKVARSGLHGHLGSFKMYAKSLNTLEVKHNYSAQRPFFTGIKTPHRIL